MDYPNYYGILPAAVRYAKIADRAKILFSEITALSNKWGYCSATNGYFAELYDCSASAISQHISALTNGGFIRCEYVETGTGNQTQRHIYPLAMVGTPFSTANPPLKHSLTPPLAQLNHNNTSINTKEYIHIEAEEKKEENQDKIINASKYAKDAFLAFLEANPQYKLDVPPAKFAAAVDGHFNKLQREGQTFELQVPTGEGKFYSWFAKRMAGVRSWMGAAASFDKKATTTQEQGKVTYKVPVEAPAKRERLGPVEMPKINGL